MNSPRRLRVLIIDRDRRVRRALRELLTAEPILRFAGSWQHSSCADPGERPAARCGAAGRPATGSRRGLGLALTLHRIGLPVVVLTTATSLREQAQEYGTAAFFEKDDNLHLIPQARRTARRPPK